MVDQMVLKAQKWVNATYGSVAGYNRCAEDGSTGWQTIYSLTRALQYELGITALSDSFGPTTFSKLTAYGNVGGTSSNLRIRIIAEAALYCKGYSGGGLDGSFPDSTQIGLSALVQDMGFGSANVTSSVSPKVFKALLTMDAYVLVAKGDPEIRLCQQWLNSAYLNRGQFYIGPCDGVFSRNVQSALVLAIQYELGMTDSQVTGSIGPGTRTGLQSAAARVGPSNGSPTWIRLFQMAVACNRYKAAWDGGGGVYSDRLANSVSVFQEFCQLRKTGDATYETWMSLLVSTGDPDRRGKAIDCAIPLNSATIATVKSYGYEYVGRYLTGGTNKVMTNSEIALIFDNGMSIFPLYQEWGDKVVYFSYDQGFAAGQAACAAAKKFGIAAGTVLYFSVDFDALDTEISSYVIPHFRGIADAVQGFSTNYAIGVYGCRNVCLRLSDAGLTSRSFVSGMSAGYSGNLGYKLPDNWAFDQISNQKIGTGAGNLEIDNDIVSGRDTGFRSVSRPRDPNDTYYAYLVWLEARALQYKEKFSTPYSRTELVGQWLRKLDPVNDKVILGQHVSDQVFGEYEQGYLDFVKAYTGRPDLLPPRDPHYLWDSDPSHFGASFGAVLTHGFSADKSRASIADFGCWGGDLLSVLGQVHGAGVGTSGAYSLAKSLIASKATGSYFDLKDWIADVDAVVLGLQARSDSSLLLSDLFPIAYANAAVAKRRYQTFLTLRFNSSTDTLAAATRSMFGDMDGVTGTVVRDAFWFDNFGGTGPGAVPEAVREEVIRAWVSAVLTYSND